MCVYIYIHTHTYIYTPISKPNGNHKPKIYNRYTEKKKSKPNTILLTVIKSKEEKTKVEGKKKKY